jgi:hypothetical protein
VTIVDSKVGIGVATGARWVNKTFPVSSTVISVKGMSDWVGGHELIYFAVPVRKSDTAIFIAGARP